ncbi:MAG: TetR family transcriptional regulator [Frankiales bacterium]|nr:TetR family transcriptional regulator [Frankiales bacterium]
MRTRASYHHGDLRAALVAAAVGAARAGGPDAVKLTALAAEVGVSAAAAYRRFPDGLEDLLRATGDVARAELADRIARKVAAVRGSDPADVARRRFRASGLAYVEYVSEQPGLFAVAQRHPSCLPPGEAPDPHGLLEQRLDALVVEGLLPAERRPLASVAAWAAVHGLALLLAEGALAQLPAAQRRQAVDRTLDMVERGL